MDAPVPFDEDVDVAIVGDGLVGRPLALALAARNWQVALIDRAPLRRSVPADPLDERCTAISSASRDWLSSQDLYDAEAVAEAPIRSVRVSHQGYFGGTRLHADELDEPLLGATFENRRFVASLGAALEGRIAQNRIAALHGQGPVAVQQDDAAITLTLSGQSDAAPVRVRARLLIAADGAASRTRELLDIPARHRDYDQQAVLATVRLDRDHHGVAHERFTAAGPLALLPRPGQRINVVLCAPADEALRLEACSDAAWLSSLAARMPRRFGRPLASGPRLRVPLECIEATAQHRGRALLLGNAARLLHPVAGQGFNLALRDVAALVELLGEARGGFDPGADAQLASLLLARRADQQTTLRATDLLARSFRGHFAPLGHARAVGLLALDSVGPARRAFARRAMRGR